MTKVSEVMEFMHQAYKSVFRKMMERESMNGDSTVDGVLKHFTPDKVLTNEENVALAALSGAQSRSSITKFAPQLSFDERCAILGLHRLGYHAEALARAYKVDRRTIAHIFNVKSSRYKNVRDKEKEMGSEFINKYVTPQIRAHVEGYKVEQQGNNKLASGVQGIHTVKGTYCDYQHRVIIGWCDPRTHDVETAGWYYRDLDGDMPEQWFTSGGDSMKTSTNCYKAMVESIMDKIT